MSYAAATEHTSGRLAIFEALAEHFGRDGVPGYDWRSWPDDYRDPHSPAVAALAAWPFDAPLNAPFAIAGGAKTEARNFLVRLSLGNGISGWGEGAPKINDGSRQKFLRAARRVQ